MKALIIKEKWLNLILSGKKTWEIRSSSTRIRGKILLIKSGSKQIFGECELVDTIKLDLDQYKISVNKHCINVKQDILPYKNTYAWVLQNPQEYNNPIPYKHPMGAVIWVNID